MKLLKPFSNSRSKFLVFLLTILFILLFFKDQEYENHNLRVNSEFTEKVLSGVEVNIDELPISVSSKAILHLVENHKEEKSCKTCNKVQQKLAERALTANILDKLGPCNFLVFGTGFDSVMWSALNSGRTVFLEDNLSWIEKVKGAAPFLEIYKVHYPVRRRDYPLSLQRYQKDCKSQGAKEHCFLFLQLPQEIRVVNWDIIMVDAPSDAGDDTPSRQMSIFTAATLARMNKFGAHVLVHDAYREVERTFSDEFLCPENLIESLDRSAKLFSGSRLAIRHYYIRGSAAKEFCLS